MTAFTWIYLVAVGTHALSRSFHIIVSNVSAPDDYTWGVDIMISTEAMCLGVLLDSSLNFASHVGRLSGLSFYRAACNADAVL